MMRMNNSFSIQPSSNPPSSRAYKNFLRLKNYIQLTNQMLLDYNHTISEYETITNEYIQKLSNLSSKYTSCISQYQKTLVYSDAKIKELLNLFHRIPEVFSLQISKMKNINAVIGECGINAVLDNPEIKDSNIKFEELVNDFENREKKLNKYTSDFINSKNILFDTYRNIEDSLVNAMLANENKKIVMNEVFMQNYQNASEKEKNFINTKQDLMKYRKHYFNAYDKYIDFSENKFKNTLNILKSDISTFATIFLTYYKTSHMEMEQMIKSISENEMKVDFSGCLTNLIGNVERDFPIIKYVINVVNDRWIDNSNNVYDIQKLKKDNYFIKDDKINLKDEDVYEIVKMMYGQFQFVDEKYYNLAEEQKKLKIKTLADKLLYYGLKKQNIFTMDEITPIKDDEVTHLLTLLNKPNYRFDFLKVLNLFRAQGSCEMPQREFEITKKIFLFIADKINKENDVLSSKLILILSQTFYIKENDQRIYLFKFLQNHEMFDNLAVWEKYLIEMIEDDLNRSNLEILNDPKQEKNKKTTINNILLAHLMTFCHNMIDFGMKVENIKKIIEPLITKYNLDEDSIKQINELMQKNLNEKDINL